MAELSEAGKKNENTEKVLDETREEINELKI